MYLSVFIAEAFGLKVLNFKLGFQKGFVSVEV